MCLEACYPLSIGGADKNDGDNDQAEEDIFLRRLETAMLVHVTLHTSRSKNVQRLLLEHDRVGITEEE